MRVLHCIESLGGGGAERQLHYLARGLVERGHHVDIACFDGGVFEARLPASVTLHRIRHRRLGPQLWALSRVVAACRPDVVQTWLGRMNVVGGLASLAGNRAWIYSERSVRLHDRGLPGAVRGWLGARAPLVLANSDAGAQLWRRRGARVAVVPNGVPVADIVATPPAARASLDIADDAELIVWAGRFAAAKNLPFLAQLLARVLAARPRAVALVVGDGEERPRFAATMAALGIAARVRLVGRRDDVWALLKTSDVLVSTSLAEGRPNVVLEAMAARCPLVLSSIAPHRELAGDVALLFDPRALDDAAAQLGRALEFRDEAAQRAQLAFTRVQAQSIDAMVDAHLDRYRQLVGDRARTARPIDRAA